MELTRLEQVGTDETIAELGLGAVGSHLIRELASLTNPSAYDTTYLTHGIHSYAAKYIPQIPRRILEEHTNERHYVLDPFCGSGTTLVEAAILGRKSVGVDSHPIATLISRAKTTALSTPELEEVDCFTRDLKAQRPSILIPEVLRRNEQLRHWFSDIAIAELEQVRQRIAKVRSDSARVFLQCVYSSVIVGISRQESETRYAAVDKKLERGEVAQKLLVKLGKSREAIAAFSSIPQAVKNQPRILNADIRTIGPRQLRSDSIDLVVTSPPYPNSYDYYLYHKWRMWWLGMDVKATKESEIGSRNEHSSRKAAIDVYVSKMHDAFATVSRVLKPSKLAYVLIGDAVLGGKFYNLRDVFEEITKNLELELIDATDYSLAKVSRSFNEKRSAGCHGGVKHPDKRQHILVFRRVRNRRIVIGGRAQATPLAKRRTGDLTSVKSGETISLESSDDRHIHSLGRYPSKFIPEIPRWAIETFTGTGGVVLDPFVGSGTTAVEAMIAGREAVSVDVSPYACLLTRAKTKHVKPDVLHKAAGQFSAALADPKRLPLGEVPNFELADFWFPDGNLLQLAALSKYVREELPDSCMDFFFAVISTAIRASSYQDEGQIKVKRDPLKVARGVPAPIEVIRSSFPKHLVRFQEFLALREPSARNHVIQGSADKLRFLGLEKSSIDLVVTSPPYINAMNYPMTHRYENFVLGLVEPNGKHAHEREYFGTERVYASDYNVFSPLTLEFDRARELEGALKKIFEKERKRSYIARTYFEGMARSVIQINEVLRSGGRFVLVLGRNNIRGVPIDSFGYVVSLCEAAGFEVERWFSYEIIKNAFKLTRHRTADIIPLDGVAVMRKR